MLASSPSVTYTCEAFGVYADTFISENVTEVLGYQPSDFLDNPGFWADCLHPDDKERILNGLKILFEKDFHIHEYRFQHKDGSYRWMHDVLRLIRDADAKPLEIVGSWTDITDRKQAEEKLLESESRYRELFETSLDGIAITDLSGRYLECNRAYLDLLGYDTIDQLRLKSYEDVTPHEYHAFEIDVIHRQTMTRGWCDEYEKEYVRKTGERVSVSLRAWLRRNVEGQPSGMWVIVRDITER